MVPLLANGYWLKSYFRRPGPVLIRMLHILLQPDILFMQYKQNIFTATVTIRFIGKAYIFYKILVAQFKAALRLAADRTVILIFVFIFLTVLNCIV